MGWFDEQIKQRIAQDNDVCEETYFKIAGSVGGHRIAEELHAATHSAKDAVDDILKYYHVKSREVPDGMTDLDEILEYLLRPSGIMHRQVKLTRGWHFDAFGAMLGTRKDGGQVVAFIPDEHGSYHYFDTDKKKYCRIYSKDEALFDEEAEVFYKSLPLGKLGLSDLLRFIFETISKRDLLIQILAALIVTVTGLITPQLLKYVFSFVIPSENARALIASVVFMACAAISGVFFTAIKSLLIGNITRKARVQVEAAGMVRMLSLPADFFQGKAAGELALNIQFLPRLCEIIISSVFSVGFTALFALLYILQIRFFAPKLALPAAIVLALSVGIVAVDIMIRTKILKRQMEAVSKENGLTYALICGMQKIRLSGSEKRAFARWGDQYAKEAALQYHLPVFLTLSGTIVTAISLLGTAAFYGIALQSGVSVADYYAFSAAFGEVSVAITSISGMTASIALIKPILEILNPLLQTEPEISPDREVVTRLSGGIELNNVTFRYSEDMPAVIDDLSLKIRPGQYVAIVGKTGCGKSTLMRLMLGFETPQKGAVYYDGRDLTRLDLKSLRRRIGTVMQNSQLFTGDIYSNIVISAPYLSLDDAWDAAGKAGLKEDIERMPMGMFTFVSEGQGGISGGQKQRLMIARAIAPKPRILMFDEATSALDNVTQKKVSQSLDALKCTRVVIAHRLSTIRQCDRIVVLDHGSIVEDGSYDELLSKGGFFSELVTRQQVEAAKPLR